MGKRANCRAKKKIRKTHDNEKSNAPAPLSSGSKIAAHIPPWRCPCQSKESQMPLRAGRLREGRIGWVALKLNDKTLLPCRFQPFQTMIVVRQSTVMSSTSFELTARRETTMQWTHAARQVNVVHLRGAKIAVPSRLRTSLKIVVSKQVDLPNRSTECCLSETRTRERHHSARKSLINGQKSRGDRSSILCTTSKWQS